MRIALVEAKGVYYGVVLCLSVLHADCIAKMHE